MRIAPWLALTAYTVSAPTVVRAQYIPPPPAYAPPPPPHLYIHRKVRWHHGRFGAVVVIAAPPPIWIAPSPFSPPPPPVYVTAPPYEIAPQPPIYVQPQPIYVEPPFAAAPPVVYATPPVLELRPPLPQFASRFGLGATFEGIFDLDNGDHQGWGVMGQLRYRAARHFGLELMGGYERSNNQQSFVRTDVPITFGMLIPILGPEYALSPYIVLGAGINFADLRLLDAPTMKIDDARTQLIAQGGAGLELRLGNHFAINCDARLEGRWSINGPSDAVLATTSINGKPTSPIQDTVGLRLGIGGSLYF